MIFATTDAVEGRPVSVGGEALLIKAVFESTLARARRQALERLAANAADLGADAVR